MEQIVEIFNRYGPVENVHVPKTEGKEDAKGSCKLAFESEKNARRASIQMQGYVINNMPIKLTLGTEMKAKQDIKYATVMLRNLRYDAEKDEIMKVPKPYQALRIGFSRSPLKNECLGYGHVRFASPHAADREREP